jgi:hypothetical protein
LGGQGAMGNRMGNTAEHVPRPAARCGEPPLRELLHAVEQFNAREYFECHETLEAIWIAEPGPIRTLYKSIWSQSLTDATCDGRSIRVPNAILYGGVEPFSPTMTHA